jgi:hypothetical protein
MSPKARAEAMALVTARRADGAEDDDLMLVFEWGKTSAKEDGGTFGGFTRLRWLWGDDFADNLNRARAWQGNTGHKKPYYCVSETPASRAQYSLYQNAKHVHMGLGDDYSVESFVQSAKAEGLTRDEALATLAEHHPDRIAAEREAHLARNRELAEGMKTKALLPAAAPPALEMIDGEAIAEEVDTTPPEGWAEYDRRRREKEEDKLRADPGDFGLGPER